MGAEELVDAARGDSPDELNTIAACWRRSVASFTPRADAPVIAWW